MESLEACVRRTQSICAALLAMALLCICGPMLYAQQMNASRFVLSTVTVKTGLPEGDILAIAQTTDGYLWFGTQEGLARYDGAALTLFTSATDKGLGDDAVYSLAPGRDGSLWVGTLSGLSLYEGGIFRRMFPTAAVVTRLLRDRDDRVWAGTMGAGLYSVQGGHVRAYSAGDGIPGRCIYNLAQTPDGVIWLGTDHGLVYYKGGRFHSYGATNGPFGGHIRGLAVANDGSLWIAAVAPTLYRLHGGRLTATPFPDALRNARVYSLFADRQGGLWTLYGHDGVALLQGGRWTRYTMAQGLPDDDGTVAAEDREGNVWVGTLEGAAELRQGTFSRFGTPEGLSDANVWTVRQARDASLWVGANRKGLDHIESDGSVHNYGVRDGLPPTAVLALSEDPDGSLWIGSEHGALSHLAHGRIQSFRDPDGNTQNLNAILQDPPGDLLLGQYRENGLVRFSQGRFQHLPMAGQINALARDKDGSIWVGTDHGGLTHLKDGLSRTYTVRDGLSSNFIGSIYIDPQGVVWAGTRGQGLNRIQNDRITTYGVAEGLFDATVGAILEDDSGYLWMTSEHGIYKVRKQELNLFAQGRIASVHSVSYGLEDGLTTLDCNFGPNPSVWKGFGGRLWFTTSTGIVSVDPAHSDVPNAVSPLLIERILVNQSPHDFRHGLELAPGAADLEVRYTSPDFTSPQDLHFRYRLSGFDHNWIDVGSRRTAYYTHLPPGKYTFEVEAKKGSGEWSRSSAQLNVRLLPYFWQTHWFRILCVVLFLIFCRALYRVRLRYLMARNQELEQKVRDRTGELEQAVQSLTTAHETLYEQATRDSLTRLWNRQFILEKLVAEHDQLAECGSRMSIVMADIDHFKSINDTYGHQTGDRVLREVAARISQLTREGEFAGRYGGEEFIIVLPNCSLDNAIQRAEEIRLCIAQLQVQTDAKTLSTSCSFGVATALPGATASTLIEQADTALYEAKRAGRNRVFAKGYGLALGSEYASESHAMLLEFPSHGTTLNSTFP